MKLTNPMDEQLNAAFAEKVAGWTWHVSTEARGPRQGWLRYDKDGGYWAEPNFTRSMDVVLPYLERQTFRVEIGNGKGLQCAVVICGNGPWTEWEKGGWHQGIDNDVPRASVIALLRAHGVVIEFSP